MTFLEMAIDQCFLTYNQHIAWWFGELYDRLKLWDGTSRKIPLSKLHTVRQLELAT
jgi:hypothetical protein